MFDRWNEEWKAERERLEQLLTPDELDSARATTLNAHYTAPVVIRAMYAALAAARASRTGASWNRPWAWATSSASCPRPCTPARSITGIEIDSVTARLAKLLYPDADIRHQAFEESSLADGFYDVALGNMPFGDYDRTIPDSRAGSS